MRDLVYGGAHSWRTFLMRNLRLWGILLVRRFGLWEFWLERTQVEEEDPPSSRLECWPFVFEFLKGTFGSEEDCTGYERPKQERDLFLSREVRGKYEKWSEDAVGMIKTEREMSKDGLRHSRACRSHRIGIIEIIGIVEGIDCIGAIECIETIKSIGIVLESSNWSHWKHWMHQSHPLESSNWMIKENKSFLWHFQMKSFRWVASDEKLQMKSCICRSSQVGAIWIKCSRWELYWTWVTEPG